MDSDATFERDVRRSIVLGAFVTHWGMPELRKRFQNGTDLVEVYFFPGTPAQKVSRVVTVGCSGFVKEGHTRSEFLFVLPKSLGGAQWDEVADFLMDVVAYFQRYSVRIEESATIPESQLAPKSWATRALLVSSPTGEPEALEDLHVGSQHVRLWWLVPIHAAEQKMIAADGLDGFDELIRASDTSLVDIDRPPLIAGNEGIL